MKKRGPLIIFSIILLFIIMPNVHSISEESIFSETVEDGDSVEIGGIPFKFRIDSVSNKVYVEIDVSAVIIPSGECKIKDNFKVCIGGNVSFSYRNLTDYRDVYKAPINIYKIQIKSNIGVTSTLGKNKILIDEETTAELAIENTADSPAKDVTATIKIPSAILVKDLEGCKKTFDSIIFQEDVHPTQIKKCTYKIKGLSGDDFNLTAYISFFDGIDKINTTSTVNGKVYNHSLKISSTLDKTRFDIYEKFDLKINVENINDQYDLRVTNFKIKIPEKLLILKNPKDTTRNKGIISWSGTLTSNENKEFLLELQGNRADKYTLVTEASYKTEKFSRSAKKESDIEVYCDCPSIQHDFSQGIVVPDQRIGLTAIINNPSPDNDFKNVKINYHTNIPNIQDYSTAYGKINPLQTIKIFDSSITTPPLDEIYYFNITAIYESSSNQVFVVKDEIIIKVPGMEETEAKEETQVEEEFIEIEEEQQETEEVQLGTEETKEILDEKEKKETIGEEILVTTLEDEKESPIKALTIIAYIAALIFILVVLIIFKRKKDKKPEKNAQGKDFGIKGEKIQMIKESLSSIFRKKENKSRKPDYSGNQDPEYRELEKQIRNLQIAPEGESQTKKGLFGRIFRKK